MTFPDTRLDERVELLLSTWVDVSTYVFGVDGTRAVSINRGRSDETRDFDTMTCDFDLDNTDGRFSPRNPSSPYYGLLGRNTRCRVSVPSASSYLWLGGGSGYASAPDSATLSVTGDIDIRADVWLDSWREGTDFVGKYITTGNQRSYQFIMNDDGTLRFQWSTDGTANTAIDATIPVPITRGRLSVRVTLDVNNGAAGKTCVFYYSTDTNLSTATWTTLDTVISAGTTSIFNSTAIAQIGYVTGSNYRADRYGYVYSAQIRSGIAGTIVGYPIFSTQTAGAASFIDGSPTPQTWTMNSPGVIDSRDYRFFGEVAEWPTTWDTRFVAVTSVGASGPIRRLSQGGRLSSVIRQAAPTYEDIRQYWPMEEATSTGTLGSGIAGRTGLKIGAAVDPQSDSSFLCSDPILKLNGAAMTGSVPGYATPSPAAIRWRFLISFPDGGSVNNAVILRMFGTGNASRWDLTYTTAGAGSLNLLAYDSNDTLIDSTGAVGFAVDGFSLYIECRMVQNAADIDLRVRVRKFGVGTSDIDDTFTSRTIGRATAVHVNPAGSAGHIDVGFGHLSVQSLAASDPDNAKADNVFNAWQSERASDRISRIADENDLTVNVVGLAADSEQMGWQHTNGLLPLIKEAADSDRGFLLEPRAPYYGLQFRPKSNLFNQPAAVTLDYTTDIKSGPVPLDDDSTTRNIVSLTRIDGATVTVQDDDGPMGTEDPPSGVGRYEFSTSRSFYTDDWAADQANWELHVGTIDEPRWPELTVWLERGAIATSASKSAAIRSIDIGDRIDVQNLPDWFPPDDIQMTVQGYKEEIAQFGHRITFYGMPYVIYGPGTYSVRRYDDASAVTAEVLDTTETGVDFTAGTYNKWARSDGNFDVNVGGERMTVTALSGTHPNYTATVTRSVNGVVKSHALGVPFRIWQTSRAYYGLGADPTEGIISVA